ncbi:hypothetical protein EB439_23640 [Escherichia coli]|nr:hypothetical protein [Escherichia coli]
MPVQDVIPPYEQMYLLNQQLICNADQLKHAVITVGGQAVQYWISYYHAQYGDRLPDERLTTSVDCVMFRGTHLHRNFHAISIPVFV